MPAGFDGRAGAIEIDELHAVDGQELTLGQLDAGAGALAVDVVIVHVAVADDDAVVDVTAGHSPRGGNRLVLQSGRFCVGYQKVMELHPAYLHSLGTALHLPGGQGVKLSRLRWVVDREDPDAVPSLRVCRVVEELAQGKVPGKHVGSVGRTFGVHRGIVPVSKMAAAGRRIVTDGVVGVVIQKAAGVTSTFKRLLLGLTKMAKLYWMVFPDSIPSSRKKAWPMMLKATLCSTRNPWTPWTVTALLKVL